MSKLHQDDGQPATGQKVALATTAYDRPDDSYTFSLASSREALHAAGIQTAYYLLHGNCHVDDARNRIVQEFLLSDCTDLVFLDADVSWQPEDLVKLCQYPVDVVGAVYPYRREDKQEDMPVQLLPAPRIPLVNAMGLLEVAGMPAGFLRITRKAVDRLLEDCESFDGHNGHESETPLMFQRTLIDGTRWGGDLDFCRRWRETGGKVYCDPEITLGHAAKVVYTGNLSAFMRRSRKNTLGFVANKIKKGTHTIADLREAITYVNNPFAGSSDLLATAIACAAKADGPILETGSGLTTILMAAATDQTVWCIEHDPVYAAITESMAREAGVTNIAIVTTTLSKATGWYDLGADRDAMPDEFSLGLNDGPPRYLGFRFPFFIEFGDACYVIVVDDCHERLYREYVQNWAASKGRQFDFIPAGTAVISADRFNHSADQSRETAGLPG